MILLRLEAKTFSRLNNTNIEKTKDNKILKKRFTYIQTIFQFLSDSISGTNLRIFFR